MSGRPVRRDGSHGLLEPRYESREDGSVVRPDVRPRASIRYVPISGYQYVVNRNRWQCCGSCGREARGAAQSALLDG